MAKSENRRIGILGGSFNPIHTGHLVFAQCALEELKLDKVIFVPTYIPPHKKLIDFADANHRLNMVSRAITDNKNFAVSDFEIISRQTSYTIETLYFLKAKCEKGTKFYFLIGSDLAAGLKTWRGIGQILKIASFAVACRQGAGIKSLPRGAKLLSMPKIDISSTLVRQFIKNGRSTRYLIPGMVYSYILKHNLYI